MPEEPANAATGGTPGDGGTPPQAADTQAQTGGTGGKPGTGETPSQAEDTTALREALRREREQRAELSRQLRQLQEKDLPEAERTAKRLAELERSNADLVTSLQQERVQSRLVAAAQRLGFADPEDAHSLISVEDLEIVDGYPKNVDKVLKELLVKKPYLASSTVRASGSAEGGVRGTGKAGADMNTLIRQAAGRGT